MFSSGCGFCTEHGTYWIPGEEATASLASVAFSSAPTGWFACDTCAGLISRERWDLLLERQVAALKEMTGAYDSRLDPRIRGIAQTVQQVFLQSRRGGPIRRARTPQQLAPGEDLEAYITGWRETWAGTPAFLTADGDRRATELRDAFASWGVDLTNKAIRRGLWALVAIMHAQGEPFGIALSATLASAEAGVRLDEMPELE